MFKNFLANLLYFSVKSKVTTTLTKMMVFKQHTIHSFLLSKDGRSKEHL